MSEELEKLRHQQYVAERKGVISYGMDLMLALLDIVQGVISTIMQAAGFGQPQSAVLPSEIVSAIEGLWIL